MQIMSLWEFGVTSLLFQINMGIESRSLVSARDALHEEAELDDARTLFGQRFSSIGHMPCPSAHQAPWLVDV